VDSPPLVLSLSGNTVMFKVALVLSRGWLNVCALGSREPLSSAVSRLDRAVHLVSLDVIPSQNDH